MASAEAAAAISLASDIGSEDETPVAEGEFLRARPIPSGPVANLRELNGVRGRMPCFLQASCRYSENSSRVRKSVFLTCPISLPVDIKT